MIILNIELRKLDIQPLKNNNNFFFKCNSIPSKKKYKERRRKGAPLIMSRSS